MRIPLRMLGLTVASLLVGLVAVGLAKPSAASAGTPGTASSGAGDYYSCSLKGGQAYCWGENYAGQLGDGTTAYSDVPVAVDTSGVLAGKTLTQLATADATTCALDSSGGAYCWGDNENGQLGDGELHGS